MDVFVSSEKSVWLVSRWSKY